MYEIFYISNVCSIFDYNEFEPSTYLTILYISYIDVHQLVYKRTNIYSNITV